ncbi:MAG: hypothetical protein AB8I08_33550 [Sandaracinaceae bacterium]
MGCRAVAMGLVFSLSLFACGESSPPDAGPDPVDAGRDAGGSGREPCSRDAGASDAGVASGLNNVCAGALVLSGFGLRHDGEAQRMSRFAVHPSLTEHAPDGCAAGATLRGATLVADLGAEGSVQATYHVAGVGASPLPTTRGSVAVDLVQMEEGRGAELVDLVLAGMEDAPAVAVVLDGVEVDTDVGQGPDYPIDYDEADGYTLRGWGAAIENVTRDGNDLRFDVSARVALGRGDDPAMNRALSEARLSAVVHYLVVGLPVAPATGSVSYTESHFGHGRRELEVCRPEAALTELTIDGEDLPRAAPGLTRFSVTMFPGDAPNGDRIRELSMQVEGFEWDPGVGEARMRVEGYVSNAGPPAPLRPMSVEVEAEVALLQWDGTGPVESLRWEAPIVEGRNALALPFEAR